MKSYERLKTRWYSILFAGFLLSRGDGLSSPIYFPYFELADQAFNSLVNLAGEWDIKSEGEEEWTQLNLPQRIGSTERYTLRRAITLDSSLLADSYRLLCYGAEGACSFILNGKMIGGHEGHSLPFSIAIPGDLLIKQSANQLIIQVDSRLDYRQTIPLSVRHHGAPPARNGLYRPIFLVAERKPRITDLSFEQVRGPDKDYISLTAEFELETNDQSTKIQFQLIETASRRSIWQSGRENIHFEENQSPSVTVNMPVDAVTSRSSLSVSVCELVIRLHERRQSHELLRLPFFMPEVNGRARHASSFPLKIIEWVEDNDIRQLGENMASRIRTDLENIKQTGADAVRVISAPPALELVDLCDQLGLGVLIEIPLINPPSGILHNSEYTLKAETLLEQTISVFKRHPSVIAWGVGMGYDISNRRTRLFLRRLTDTVKSLDARPVYAGVRGKLFSPLPLDWTIIDYSKERYNSISDNSDHVIWRCEVLLKKNDRDPYAAERQQAFLMKDILQDVLRSGNGVIVGPLRDWRGDQPHTYWGPRKDGHIFSAGLITRSGDRRLSFSVVQSLFSGTECPMILPVDESEDNPNTFLIMGLVVLVFFLLFFRTDRRLQKYLRRVFLYPHGFYSDIGENRFFLISLTLIIGMSYSISLAVLSASLVYYLKCNLFFDEILSWFFNRPQTKSKIIWLVWHPLAFIALISLLIMALAFVQTLLLKFSVMLRKRYVKWRNLYIFILWVPANLLFTLPLAVIFYRVMQNPNFTLFCFTFLGILLLWLFIRGLKAIKVLLQLSAIQSALLFAIVLLATAAFLIGYLDITKSFLAYSQYYLSILMP